MADKDFEIQVRTTADTTGIKQTEAELDKLQKQAQGGAGGGGIGGVGGAAAAGVAIGGLLAKALTEYTAQLEKDTAEIEKQADKVVKLAVKWREAANAALSAADVRKIGEQGADAIDAIGERIKVIANEDLPLWQKSLDSIVHLVTGLKGPYKDLADAMLNGLGIQQKIAKEQKDAAFKAAVANKEAFDELKTKDFARGVEEVTNRLNELKFEQDNLDKSAANYQERWIAIEKQMANSQRQLHGLVTEQERSQASRAEDAKKTEQATQNLFKKPADFATEQENQRRKHLAEQAEARAELNTFQREGGSLTEQEIARQKELQRIISPEANRLFSQQQERERLLRAQGLAESLLPERATEQDRLKILGPVGEGKYMERLNRLAQLNQSIQSTAGPDRDAEIVVWLKKIFGQWQ